MKIIVCIKQVIGTEVVRFDPRTHKMVRSAENSYINPNDLFALEAAIQLRQRYGGHISAVTMGPPISEEVLRDAMALGVDRGVMLSDPRFAGGDTLATSYVLGMGIRKIGDFDLVLCGTESTDSDTGQVGPQLAEELDLPNVSGVEKIEKAGDLFRVERLSDGFREIIEVAPPALFTISRETVIPRLPGLDGIQEAYSSRRIDCFNLEDLGAEEAKVGLDGSGTWVSSLDSVSRQKRCELIEGDVRQQVQALMNKLIDKNLIN